MTHVMYLCSHHVILIVGNHNPNPSHLLDSMQLEFSATIQDWVKAEEGKVPQSTRCIYMSMARKVCLTHKTPSDASLVTSNADARLLSSRKRGAQPRGGTGISQWGRDAAHPVLPLLQAASSP